MALLAAVVIVFTAGCGGPWRPSTEGMTAATEANDHTLAARLRANRTGVWIYDRQEQSSRSDKDSGIYVRKVTADRIAEGVLYSRPFLAMERYLEPRGVPTSQPEEAERPEAPMRGGTAIFFRLAEASDPIPVELEDARILTSSTAIDYFDYRGRLVSEGSLKHTVEIEGIEDVECPAGRFADCLRVRVDLRIHFPWIALVDLTSYLWLSPEVGEVRRVQRFSGWFLIFWFGRTDEYRLMSYRPLPGRPDAGALPPPKWSTGALLLQGYYPRPRIAGMVIDLDTTIADE